VINIIIHYTFVLNFDGLTMNTAGRNVLFHALLVTHLSGFI